jgi:hypothetical protein
VVIGNVKHREQGRQFFRRKRADTYLNASASMPKVSDVSTGFALSRSDDTQWNRLGRGTEKYGRQNTNFGGRRIIEQRPSTDWLSMIIETRAGVIT